MLQTLVPCVCFALGPLGVSGAAILYRPTKNFYSVDAIVGYGLRFLTNEPPYVWLQISTNVNLLWPSYVTNSSLVIPFYTNRAVIQGLGEAIATGWHTSIWDQSQITIQGANVLFANAAGPQPPDGPDGSAGGIWKMWDWAPDFGSPWNFISFFVPEPRYYTFEVNLSVSASHAPLTTNNTDGEISDSWAWIEVSPFLPGVVTRYGTATENGSGFFEGDPPSSGSTNGILPVGEYSVAFRGGAFAYAGTLVPEMSEGGSAATACTYSIQLRFLPPPPTICAISTGGNIVLCWPNTTPPFLLEATTSLNTPTSWTTVPDVPTIIDGHNYVTNDMSGPA